MGRQMPTPERTLTWQVQLPSETQAKKAHQEDLIPAHNKRTVPPQRRAKAFGYVLQVTAIPEAGGVS
jgi:hypothetical protein